MGTEVGLREECDRSRSLCRSDSDSKQLMPSLGPAHAPCERSGCYSGSRSVCAARLPHFALFLCPRHQRDMKTESTERKYNNIY